LFAYARPFEGGEQPSAAKSCRPLVTPLSATLSHALELIRAERFSEAGAALAQAKDLPDPASDPGGSLQLGLMAAYARLRQGDLEATREHLRRALALGREHGLVEDVLCQAPDILANLCAVALETAIEPGYARRLIRQAGLRPPDPTLTRWPYPVRLHTLGRPAVVLRGQPLRSQGKAQHRPLLMLHYLVARGGREVPVTQLRQALWEDADERDTRGAFDMALSRLRHLLGVADVLSLHNGRLTLNDQLCWADVWACERLLGRVDGEPDPACGLALMGRALALYQGDFLAGEEAGWAVLARERVRSRLVRVTRRLGQALEQAQRWPEASQLYEQVRELFPLDEDLCRRLIRSHIEQNEFAQASNLYGRCRELLVKVLGVLPSATTTALVDINRCPPRPRLSDP
jgi:DNA-binding SARP family transcriptional activator